MVTTSSLNRTLPEPSSPTNLGTDVQWLAGEGAGSWFDINEGKDQQCQISRYDPNGKLECSSWFFEKNKQQFFIEKPFKVIHLSHCSQISIIQEESKLLFLPREIAVN